MHIWREQWQTIVYTWKIPWTRGTQWAAGHGREKSDLVDWLPAYFAVENIVLSISCLKAKDIELIEHPRNLRCKVGLTEKRLACRRRKYEGVKTWKATAVIVHVLIIICGEVEWTYPKQFSSFWTMRRLLSIYFN